MQILAENSRRHHLNHPGEDSGVPQGSSPESIANEGLKEIYTLISGTAGLATWQDISAKQVHS